MKKIITSFVVALGLLTSFNANAQAFDEGKSIVTVGYGFPNLGASVFKSVYGTYTGYTVTGMGPAFLKYEYGLSEHIGLGLAIAYSGFTIKYTDTRNVYNSSTSTYSNQTYNYKLAYTSPAFGIRFNYHFATKDKLDPYIGVAAGYKGSNFKWTTDDPNGTSGSTSINLIPVYFPITVGMRYYFTDNIGAYVEFGIDKGSVIQGGLALKF